MTLELLNVILALDTDKPRPEIELHGPREKKKRRLSYESPKHQPHPQSTSNQSIPAYYAQKHRYNQSQVHQVYMPRYTPILQRRQRMFANRMMLNTNNEALRSGYVQALNKYSVQFQMDQNKNYANKVMHQQRVDPFSNSKEQQSLGPIAMEQIANLNDKQNEKPKDSVQAVQYFGGTGPLYHF